MIVKSVEGRNFRSYETVSWSIKESGLFLIDGINPDTGRSNASGKTTLIDSIFWALYGYLPKWNGPKGGPADAVIQRGFDSCSVKVTVENNKMLYEIERQRPNKLKVTCNGSVIDGKTSDLDSRMSSFIGMTASQFLISVYISQDRNLSFYTMSDADRTQFLSVIAGLDNLNIALEKVKVEKKEIESQLDKTHGAISVLEDQIAALPSQKASLLDQVKILESRVLEESNQQSEILSRVNKEKEKNEQDFKILCNQSDSELSIQLKQIQQDYEAGKRKIEEFSQQLLSLPMLDPTYEQRVEEIKIKLNECQELKNKQHQIEVHNKAQKELIRHIIAQIEEVKNGKCQSCLQDLPEGSKNEQLTRLIGKANEIKGKFLADISLVDCSPIEEEYRKAQDELYQKKAEIEAAPNRIRIQVNGLKEKAANLLAMAKDKQSANELNKRNFLNQKNSRLREIENEIHKFQAKIQATKNEHKEVSNLLKFHEAQELSLTSKLEENKIKVLTLNGKLDEVLDLIELFGPKGLRVVYFDDIIDRIGSRAAQLLSLMTDGIYSTRIDQLGNNSKGEDKLMLRPVITRGGVELPQDDLSGGMRRTAMLAYDIAAAESVGESSVLFLDEALDGLDAVGKAEAMRLLEEVAMSRAVYVIDHTQETASSINNRIQITYKDGISTLST